VSIIRAEIVPNSNVSVQPLSVKRDWMENVSDAHAYNCFPVTLTNGLGWGISFPKDIVFIWDGVDTDKEEGHVKILSGHEYVNENRRSATISLNTKVKFTTEEDITMLTMPVPNLFLDTVIPFTTLISTSFFPHVLPAALKIIKPNVEITIPANSTAIAILPIPLSQIVSNEIDVNRKLLEMEKLISSRLEYYFNVISSGGSMNQNADKVFLEYINSMRSILADWKKYVEGVADKKIEHNVNIQVVDTQVKVLKEAMFEVLNAINCFLVTRLVIKSENACSPAPYMA
jgi:hypothetical protein